MAWDLRLNASRDLVPGIVTGDNEILQRLFTRLQRELGEWFLNVEAGLPWYQKGTGLLGSKDSQTLDLLIRKETLGTEGINRIVSYSAIYASNTRQYSIAMTLVTESGTYNFLLTEGGATWQATA